MSQTEIAFLGSVGAVSLTVAEVLCCKSKVLKLIISPDVGATSKVILHYCIVSVISCISLNDALIDTNNMIT